MAARAPFLTTYQKTESEIMVIMETMGIIPCNKSKDGRDAKNGTASVEFFKQGLELKVEVEEDKKTKTLWKYKAIRLPSLIEPDKSFWRIEKDKVIITMMKKKIEGKDKKDHYVDWIPLLHKNGLDQYDSSEDEDGNVPDTSAIKLKSETLNLPVEVEHGKNNLIEVTKDFKNFNL